MSTDQLIQDPVLPEVTEDNLNFFGDIKMEFAAILGKVELPIEQFLKLTRGSIIELNNIKTENDLDIYINDYPFAKAQVEVVGESVAVNITKLRTSK